jgi:hypothetical protein
MPHPAGVRLSVSVARALLALAAFSPYAPVLYLATSGRAGADALPWLALLALGGAGFLAAAILVGSDATRARLLAVASAIAVGVSANLLSQMAGTLALAVAALGAVAAWSAFLDPPRRDVAVAFALYVVVGLAFVAPLIGATVDLALTVTTALVWPIWLLLFTQLELIGIWLPLAIAAVLVAIALRRDQPGGSRIVPCQ